MKIRNLFLLYSPLIKGVRGLFLSTAYCLLFAVFLFGCGAGGGSAPPGSTITISPPSVSQSDPSSTTTTRTAYLTIAVKDSSGNPINDEKLTITYTWTTAPTDETGVIQLYDGSTAKTPPFDVYTDEFGLYHLRFDYKTGGGLSYSGNIEVRSGDVYATASVDVSG